MTVSEMARALELETIVEGDINRQITGGYAGDLLSWVMGKAREGDAWITVMGNLNVIAVAVLADIPCVVLSEGASLDDDAAKRADVECITVLKSNLTTFGLCARLARLLDGGMHD